MTTTDKRFMRLCLSLCILSLSLIIFIIWSSGRSAATTTTAPESTIVQSELPAFVYAGPDLNYNVVGELTAGKEVEVLARNESADWLFIEETNVLGWVEKSAVAPIADPQTLAIWNNPMAGATLSTAETLEETQVEAPAEQPLARPSYAATVSTYALNIYQQPGIDNFVIGHLDEGQQVTLLAHTNNAEWVFIQTRDGRGFINGKFLSSEIAIDALPNYTIEQYGAPTPNYPVGRVYNRQFIRLRGGPSEDYSIRGYWHYGDELVIVGRAEGRNWLMGRIRFQDVWVNADYINLPVSIDTLPIIRGNWPDPMAGEFKY